MPAWARSPDALSFSGKPPSQELADRIPLPGKVTALTDTNLDRILPADSGGPAGHGLDCAVEAGLQPDDALVQAPKPPDGKQRGPADREEARRDGGADELRRENDDQAGDRVPMSQQVKRRDFHREQHRTGHNEHGHRRIRRQRGQLRLQPSKKAGASHPRHCRGEVIPQPFLKEHDRRGDDDHRRQEHLLRKRRIMSVSPAATPSGQRRALRWKRRLSARKKGARDSTGPQHRRRNDYAGKAEFWTRDPDRFGVSESRQSWIRTTLLKTSFTALPHRRFE